MELSAKSAALELSYEKSSQHVEAVRLEERERLFRLREHLLEHEIDSLREQLSYKDDTAATTMAKTRDLEASLYKTAEDLEKGRDAARVKSREIETLKVPNHLYRLLNASC